MLDRRYKSKAVKEFNILYVDDEVVNLRIFRQSFKRDYNVYVAQDGLEAIEILKTNRIDLIITDQQMPGMTGSELLIRIVPHYPNIVRMIMTGFSDINAIASVVNEVGLDKYLVKPWNKDSLKEEFDKCLERRQEEKNAQSQLKAASRKIEISDESVELVESEIIEGLTEELKIPYEKQAQSKPSLDYDGIINCNINLKESLLPKQEELRMYIKDAFILHNHFKANKNGYWFGQRGEHVLVASYNCNAESVQSLALSSFMSACLMELFYKDELTKPSEIISNISSRIRHRFFSLIGTDQGLSADISIVHFDKRQRVLAYSGANQDLYYFDDKGKFSVLAGETLPISSGIKTTYDTKMIQVNKVSAAYFISNAIITEKRSLKRKNAQQMTIENILSEVYKLPMEDQMQVVKEYKYKDLIGMKF